METLLSASYGKLILITVCIIAIIICLSIFIPMLFKNLGVKKISTKNGEIVLTDEKVAEIKNTERIQASVEIHEVQRKQISFTAEYLKDFRNNINSYLEKIGYRYSDFNIPYVVELLYDEIINWIIFNNIENADEYITVHQKQLWLIWKNAIWSSGRGIDNIKIKFGDKMINRDECELDWKNDYFKQMVFSATKDIVYNLVAIKISHESYGTIDQSKIIK